MSIDCKATVHIGEFSRGIGKSNGLFHRPRLARTAGLRQDGSGDGRLRREGLACAAGRGLMHTQGGRGCRAAGGD